MFVLAKCPSTGGTPRQLTLITERILSRVHVFIEVGLSYQPLSTEILIWQLHGDPPSIRVPIFAQNVTFCMAVDVIPHAFL